MVVTPVTGKERVGRTASKVLVLITWLLMSRAAFLSALAVRGDAYPNLGLALLVISLLVAGSCALTLRHMRMLDGRPPGVAGRWPPLVTGVILTAAALVLAAVVSAVAQRGGHGIPTGPSFLSALACPTVPLVVAYFQRWPWRPWWWRNLEDRDSAGYDFGAPRAPHAALPPYPCPGSVPLPGQVWEVFYPYEDAPDSGKRRPALVVASGPRGIRALKITSQNKSGYPAHYAPLDTSGWQAMNTHSRASWLQLDRPAVVPHKDVHRPLGLCPQSLWNTVVRRHGIRMQRPRSTSQ
ncbi:hypothetical protein [Streptomyces sp. NPDC021969]|uniref:hypothetical protein n=1 Tax=unclassified Streptomyces TaxID=2593676 RepID=UPI0033D73A4D